MGVASTVHVRSSDRRMAALESSVGSSLLCTRFKCHFNSQSHLIIQRKAVGERKALVVSF